MSLLVLNSSSKIAQGLIRQLYAKQQFQKIICADLYPNYASIKQFLDFKQSLTPNQTQFTDQQDLHDIALQADHLIFFTHDYYALVPHKIDLLTKTLSLNPIRQYKKLIYVAPVELDHALDQDNESKCKEAVDQARKKYPNFISLRSDITFGQDSTFGSRIQKYINDSQSIYFKPIGTQPSPVYTGDLSNMVENLITDSKFDGQSFLAQTSQNIDWKQYINVIEQGLNKKAKLNSNILQMVFIYQQLIQPTSNNIFSELFFNAQYRNFTQLINRYRTLQSQDYENAVQLLKGSEYTKFDQYYEKNNELQQAEPTGLVEKLLY